MFRKFGHGHTFGGGVIFTLLMMRHAFLFALLVFAAGFVAGRAWLVWMKIGFVIQRYFDRKANRIKPRIQARVSMLRGEHHDIPF